MAKLAIQSLPLSAPKHETPDSQHHERSKRRDRDRSEVQIPGIDFPPPELGADQPAQKRTGDAEHDREDAAGGIATGHDELGQRPGDEAEENPEEPERHEPWSLMQNGE